MTEMLVRRPRLLDVLHRLRLAQPTSQTVAAELHALRHYAKDAICAVEIGSYQGVSASWIVRGMPREGRLYCIDPWPTQGTGAPNPCYAIFERHLRRLGFLDRIVVLKGTSREMSERIPPQVDFAFIDGDHTRAGLETDWSLLRSRLRPGAIVCLHDTLVPADDPLRSHGSMQYYAEVISTDPEYRLVNQVHSMSVLQRIPG